MNDDPLLMQKGGDVGWIDKGAYKEQKIEDEVWRLNVGEITPIMKIGTAWYIAKLEEKKNGRVQAFEEQEVQEKIRKALESAQFTAQRDNVTSALLKQAVVAPWPPSLTSAMEMVMQMYPRWRGS
jgi:parvulin-like peptidyl-prolyl isomerase